MCYIFGVKHHNKRTWPMCFTFGARHHNKGLWELKISAWD
jgi:hypothetical protein